MINLFTSSFHALKNITGNRVAVIRDNGKAFGTLLLYNSIEDRLYSLHVGCVCNFRIKVAFQ